MRIAMGLCLALLLVCPVFNVRGQDDAAAPAVAMRKERLLAMANRLVDVQRTTPDENIQKIIEENHLADSAALEKLSDSQNRTKIIRVAIALYQASSYKSDPVATGLMKEFRITYTPNAGGSPTNAALKPLAPKSVSP